MKAPDVIGTGTLLYCGCKRGKSGTVRDGGSDLSECLWSYKEVLYDGPASSGKTYSDLVRIVWMMQRYPGLRCLVLRRTRVSAKTSWVVILEDHVLGPDHIYLRSGGNRHNRTAYRDANGSELIIGGTDKIEEYLSSEWDIVLACEATEPGMTEYDWNTIGTRMRGVAIPHPHCDYPDGVYDDGTLMVDMLDRTIRFVDRIVLPNGSTRPVSSVDDPQAMADAKRFGGRLARQGEDDHGVPLFFRQRVAECNPSMIEGEQHWLMKRYNAGLMVRIRAAHGDNPRNTADYLDELRALPEPFRSVYYEGKWVSVEGKCWPTYDPARHLILGSYEYQITAGQSYLTITEPSWCAGGRAKVFPVSSVVAGFDWGINHPGSLQVFAVVGLGADKRAFRVCEILMSGGQGGDVGSIDWWADRVVQVVDKYRVQAILCDPSARAIWEHFNKALGHRAGRTKGGICQAADNTRSSEDWTQGGIDLVRTMFAQDRLFLLRDCHFGPVDVSLKHKRRPVGWHEEIPGYVLGRDAQNPERMLPYPDKRRGMDDGCDAARYALMDIFESDRRLRPAVLRTYGELDPRTFTLTGAQEEELLRRQELEQLGRKPRRW